MKKAREKVLEGIISSQNARLRFKRRAIQNLISFLEKKKLLEEYLII